MVLLPGASVQAQYVYADIFGALQTTRYDFPYDGDVRYLSYGARLAAGWHKLQLGVEYQQQLSDPTLDLGVNNLPFGTDTYDEQFFGFFLRSKLARYPAARSGVVLMAGAGVYDTQVTFEEAAGTLKVAHAYDKYIGLNGGLGLSFPIGKFVMLETAYRIYYAERPAIPNFRDSYTATYHSVQLGLSYNLVFGSVRDRYEEILQNKYGK